jgi:hypothetical protein
MNNKLNKLLVCHGYKKPYTGCNKLNKKVYSFDDNFILKLDGFLGGQNSCSLNKSDINYIDMFVQYASKEIKADGWEKQLDELLAQIVNMLDPKAIAVESSISASSVEESKAKAVDLLEALGSLQKLEDNTQSQIDSGIAEAIKKASEVALVMG